MRGSCLKIQKEDSDKSFISAKEIYANGIQREQVKYEFRIWFEYRWGFY